LGVWLACRERTNLIEGDYWEESLDRSRDPRSGVRQPRIRNCSGKPTPGFELFDEEELHRIIHIAAVLSS
jgi:hypothetical protein